MPNTWTRPGFFPTSDQITGKRRVVVLPVGQVGSRGRRPARTRDDVHRILTSRWNIDIARMSGVSIAKPGGGALAAVAVDDPRGRFERTLHKALGTPFEVYWTGTPQDTTMRIPESDRSFPVGDPSATDVAGVSLLEKLDVKGQTLEADESAWLSRRSWAAGGPLEEACPKCRKPFKWFDLQHPDALEPGAESCALTCACTPSVRPPKGAVGRLVRARRWLDGALWAQRPSEPVYRVYAYERVDKSGKHLYVGETGKAAEVRHSEHVMTKGSTKVGNLRPDLLPELPPLASRRASLAAEHWVSELLAFRGWAVHGNGRSPERKAGGVKRRPPSPRRKSKEAGDAH